MSKVKMTRGSCRAFMQFSVGWRMHVHVNKASLDGKRNKVSANGHHALKPIVGQGFVVNNVFVTLHLG